LTLPVEHGPGSRPEIALTFDDGPGGATAHVLDVLGTHGVFGTFFMTGAQARADPALARAVGAIGHEIGSHTFDHLDHDTVPVDVALGDMLDGAVALERVFGGEPGLYRAPYGHFVPATLAEADARGWTCVGWSVLARDWAPDETADTIAARVIAALEPGAIVALHDGRHGKPADHRAMLHALPAIVDAAQQRDLEPVTVSALLAN
jgi:peptidoglycan/xylan/chitin deacetylase (PgdA/CDA1 family)